MATRNDNTENPALRARPLPRIQGTLFAASPIATANYYATAWAWRRW